MLHSTFSVKEKKKGKNTAGNETMELHKYIPDSKKMFNLPWQMKIVEEFTLTNF